MPLHLGTEAEFAQLRQRWMAGTEAERGRMGPDLARYLQAHGQDPTAQVVRVWLAWLDLAHGDLAEAEGRLLRADAGSPGLGQDLARAARAALLRRQGKVQEALDLGGPLVGMLLDARDRDQLREELILATIDLRRQEEAFQLLARWLQDPDLDSRTHFLERWPSLVHSLSEPLLRRMLVAGAEPEVALDLPEGVWVTLVRRLAGLALEQEDAALAELLLRVAPKPLELSTQGRLARLGRRALQPRFHGRTLGLLLALEGDEARRRGAALMAGLAQGLLLPQPEVRVLLRETGPAPAAIETAMDDLLHEGAGALALALGDAEGGLARELARQRGVPLLRLEGDADGLQLQGKALGASLAEAWKDLSPTWVEDPAAVREGRARLRQALERSLAAQAGSAGPRIRVEPHLPSGEPSPKSP